MATYTKDNVVFGDNTEIPNGVYTVRITDMKWRLSSSGNPMIEAAGEIVYPATVEVNGKTIQVAGRKLRNWYNLLDPSSPYGAARLIEGLTRAGLNKLQDLPEGVLFDDGENNPRALEVFKGAELNMMVRCSPRKCMRPPTMEERQRGITDYQPIKDPNTNEDVVLGYQLETDWSQVVGPADKNRTDTTAF